MKKTPPKNNGNLLLGAVLIAALLGISTLLMVELGSTYFKTKKNSVAKAVNLNKNNFNLNLIAELFQIRGTRLPILYLEPYPTESNFKKFPIVRVITPLKTGASSFLPDTETIKVGDLTKSVPLELTVNGLFSLRTPVTLDKNRNGELLSAQHGYAGGLDITQLTPEQVGSYVSSPNSNWPEERVNLTRALFGFTVSKVTFLKNIPYDPKLTTEKENSFIPVPIEKIRLTLGDNEAEINVSPPPAPDCVVSLVKPGVVVSGTTVEVKIEVKSIISNAVVEGRSVALPREQSISNLSTWKVFGTAGVTVPTSPLPGSALNAGLRWNINASVTGVAPNNVVTKCISENIEVRSPEPPKLCDVVKATAPVTFGTNLPGPVPSPASISYQVSLLMKQKNPSSPLIYTSIRRSTGASGGGNRWTSDGTLDMQTLNKVCSIFGYKTYVSSTCMDNERSGRYPNGKCNNHSPGDNQLIYFSGDKLITYNMSGSDKYKMTWLATITCKDKIVSEVCSP